MEDAAAKGNTLAAPLIFIIITIVQFVPRYIEKQIKKGSMSETEVKLRQEIKQLYKEAGALSQPSTFAQAAKLRRTAAAKEKELAKYLEQNGMEKSSYVPFMKIVTPLKVLTYIVFTFWFWNSPVASISKELVQPFGNILSWKAGVLSDGNVMDPLYYIALFRHSQGMLLKRLGSYLGLYCVQELANSSAEG